MRSIAKNSMFNILNWIVPIIIMMVTVPIYTKYLGSSDYGNLILMNTIISFLSLLNFGTGDSIIKYISEEKNAKGMSKLINTSFILNMISSIITVSILLIFSNSILTNFIKSTNYYYRILLIILLLTILVNFITGNFACIFKGNNNYKIPSIINIAIYVGTNICSIILLLLGYKLLAIIIVNFIGSIIDFFVYIYFTKKIYRSYHFKIEFDYESFNKIFKYSLYSFLNSILAVIIFNSDKLFIAYYFNSKEVTYYTIPANLSQKIQQFVGASLASLFPVISQISKAYEKEELFKLLHNVNKFVCIFCLFICIPAITYSYRFLYYWIGSENATNGYIVFSILCIAYSLLAFSAIPYYFFNGIGLPKYNTYFSLLSGILNLTLNVILIPKYKILGAAIATLISSFYVIIFYAKLCKVIKYNIKIINFKLVRYLFLILIYFVFCFVNRLYINGFISLTIICVMDILVYLCILNILNIFDINKLEIVMKFRRHINELFSF